MNKRAAERGQRRKSRDPAGEAVRSSTDRQIGPMPGPGLPQRTESIVSAENWHEERDRLVQLLEAIESGKITHVDEEDLRQLQATNPNNIAELKERLAQLNARLGDGKT